MYSINKKTQSNIERCLQQPYRSLVTADYKDESSIVRAARGSGVVFSTKRDNRRIGRGNPLLARRRLRTIEQVDKRLSGLVDKNVGNKSRV